MGQSIKKFGGTVRVEILVCTKDRHSELALLIQSLLNQDFKDWDLMILDDASGTPIDYAHFIQKLIIECKKAGHRVISMRNPESFGVCYARNYLNDVYIKRSRAEFALRLDDDVILDSDYITKLLKVIDAGYDVASGVTTSYGNLDFKRNVSFIGDVINVHKFNKEGEIILNKDDCGIGYTSQKILKTHQFRSCALFKRDVVDNIEYPSNLTKVGFREEGFYSFKCLIKGYKIGVDTIADAHHFQAPSGGTRSPSYSSDVQLDNETFLKWCKKMYKKHGDFLNG